MRQKEENIKVSCKIIAEYLRRIKNELNAHKNLPVELYIIVNSAHREISKETHKIRRTAWRKKYLRAINTNTVMSTTYSSNGGINVYRKA